MSQQTVISVVLPRFKEFIAELPDIQSLANCSDEKLRKLWAGLGYYARARNLRNGAKYIIDELNSVFPNNKNDWLKVPGCGPYTASIISSICFHEPVACVDGNVIRVVSRLLNLQSGVWEKSGQDKISCYVNGVISNENPGDFNQAMMDLGSIVCKKQNPNCTLCPVQNYCTAFKNNSVEMCPPVKPRKNFQNEDVFALIFLKKKSDEFFLVERNKGFLNKTIGFPLLRAEEAVSLSILISEIKKFGYNTKYLQGNFRHSITHHKITGHTILIETPHHDDHFLKMLRFFSFSEKNQWISKTHLKQNLSSSLDHKVLKILSSI
ncbi:A/G-specific adenine glycosylase [Silvanigrella aquatica]|nr:A/G-specific adenine glycosylase [Silvanigrella aquatica]